MHKGNRWSHIKFAIAITGKDNSEDFCNAHVNLSCLSCDLTCWNNWMGKECRPRLPLSRDRMVVAADRVQLNKKEDVVQGEGSRAKFSFLRLVITAKKPPFKLSLKSSLLLLFLLLSFSSLAIQLVLSSFEQLRNCFRFTSTPG